MVEQIIAASPLGTKTSAQDTRPLPHVIIRNPRKAWMRSVLKDGKVSFRINKMKLHKIKPAVTCLIAAKRKGGKCITPMRITKNVVPQIRQMPARQK